LYRAAHADRPRAQHDLPIPSCQNSSVVHTISSRSSNQRVGQSSRVSRAIHCDVASLVMTSRRLARRRGVRGEQTRESSTCVSPMLANLAEFFRRSEFHASREP
jgi:hypothetical protein